MASEVTRVRPGDRQVKTLISTQDETGADSRATQAAFLTDSAMKLSRHLLAIFFCCLPAVGCSDACTRNWPEQPDSATGLALVLSPEIQTIKCGDSPVFTATLINRGTKELLLVEPGDGSDCGWRTPIIEWSRIRRDPGGRCGNINPLELNEVFTLQPGSSRALNGWIGRPYLSGPGRYRVSLRYTNEPEKEMGGMPLGEHDASAIRAIRRSLAVTVVSNAVEIVVE
jgi:hypothetical protein